MKRKRERKSTVTTSTCYSPGQEFSSVIKKVCMPAAGEILKVLVR